MSDVRAFLRTTCSMSANCHRRSLKLLIEYSCENEPRGMQLVRDNQTRLKKKKKRKKERKIIEGNIEILPMTIQPVYFD